MKKWKVPGACIPQCMLQTNVNDQSICGICYEVMTQPIQIICNEKATHVFGKHCLETWWKKPQSDSKCPFCNIKAKGTKIHTPLANNQSLQIHCYFCLWTGKASQYCTHLETCDPGFEQAYQTIESYEKLEQHKTKILQHLQKSHKKIIENPQTRWQLIDWSNQLESDNCIKCAAIKTKCSALFIQQKKLHKMKNILEQIDNYWYIRYLFK